MTTKNKFKHPKHKKEQRIMKPIADARRKNEDYQIDKEASADLSVEAELDRVLKAEGII